MSMRWIVGLGFSCMLLAGCGDEFGPEPPFEAGEHFSMLIAGSLEYDCDPAIAYPVDGVACAQTSDRIVFERDSLIGSIVIDSTLPERPCESGWRGDERGVPPARGPRVVECRSPPLVYATFSGRYVTCQVVPSQFRDPGCVETAVLTPVGMEGGTEGELWRIRLVFDVLYTDDLARQLRIFLIGLTDEHRRIAGVDQSIYDYPQDFPRETRRADWHVQPSAAAP